MRRLPVAAPLLALAVLLSLAADGCGQQSDSTPVACLRGPEAFLNALHAAPAAVELRGVPISDCLAENQGGGELARVGAALLRVATGLNSIARAHPGGAANLRLGYLLGAAQRGADRTNGIHAELIRRLAAAASYSPDNRPLPPAFTRAYREGFDAGEARG